MGAICFDEVDHRVAIEDVDHPWCYLIGLPIRETVYGIIRGLHGVTEHHRVQETVARFENTLIVPKMPLKLGWLTVNAAGSDCIINPQHPTILSQDVEKK